MTLQSPLIHLTRFSTIKKELVITHASQKVLFLVRSFLLYSWIKVDRALELEAAGKYGEQVAWLAAAIEQSKASTEKSLIKNIPIQSLESEIKDFIAICTATFASANKDNDKIYMETVPKSTDLIPIQPARMVNPILIPLAKDLEKVVKKPIFRNLVPLRVHQALSKYSYKKETLINSVIASMNEATNTAIT